MHKKRKGKMSGHVYVLECASAGDGPTYYVGHSDNLGKNFGSIRARDGASQPQQVTAIWEVSVDKQMKAAPSLSIISGPAVAAELNRASPTIALLGVKPNSFQQDWLGVFKRRAALVNGYASYVKADDDKVMMWQNGVGWVVGSSRAAACWQAARTRDRAEDHQSE